jgi:hypothetical protein
MKNNKTSSPELAEDIVKQLQASPLRGIKPISPNPIEVPIEKIEIDRTNPGTVSHSMRDQRRGPSMMDSIDIIGGVVYPGVVCQKQGKTDEYIHIDCFGRLHALQARGFKTMSVIVFPPLTREQIICLRQTLNAAQEPFDAVSNIHDLRLLAKERGLDVSNADDVRMLVRDLPARVRKFEKDLIRLGRWHPEALEKLGESYEAGKAIGMDQVRQLTGIMNSVRGHHPNTFEKLGGDRELSKTLAEMFHDGKFRVGTRSQDGIRKLNANIRSLRADHDKLFEFFDQQKEWNTLGNGTTGPNIVKLCGQLIEAVLQNAGSLSAKERQALEGTVAVLSQYVGTPK